MPVSPHSDVVGVVPAAGRARRLAPLPCSKELYPVGFGPDVRTGEPRVKVATEYLLEKYRMAGVRRAIVVVREGKWDIPGYLLDGQRLGMALSYVVIDGSSGPPATVGRAVPFLASQTVVFGFPDILCTPDDLFQRLLERLHETKADMTLALYRAHDHRAMDMIDVDDHGRIRSIVLKPPRTSLRYGWICAAWRPSFTDFMHTFLTSTGRRLKGDRKIDAQGDLPMGAVLQAAIRAGLHAEGVRFPAGRYLDIGTPETLAKAVRFSGQLR